MGNWPELFWCALYSAKQTAVGYSLSGLHTSGIVPEKGLDPSNGFGGKVHSPDGYASWRTYSLAPDIRSGDSVHHAGEEEEVVLSRTQDTRLTCSLVRRLNDIRPHERGGSWGDH